MGFYRTLMAYLKPAAPTQSLDTANLLAKLTPQQQEMVTDWAEANDIDIPTAMQKLHLVPATGTGATSGGAVPDE